MEEVLGGISLNVLDLFAVVVRLSKPLVGWLAAEQLETCRPRPPAGERH